MPDLIWISLLFTVVNGNSREKCSHPVESEHILFEKPIGVCSNGSRPLSMMPRQVHKGFQPGPEADIGFPELIDSQLKPTPKTIRNQCGAHMSKQGLFICEDCMSVIEEDICYYTMESSGGGHMMLNLSVTKITVDYIIVVYEGRDGYNTMKEVIQEVGNLSYTAVGTTMMVLLRILQRNNREISFNLQLSTEGDSQLTTGGCGGVLRDTQLIFNPGYKTPATPRTICVWRYFVPKGKRVQLNVKNTDIECFQKYVIVKIYNENGALVKTLDFSKDILESDVDMMLIVYNTLRSDHGLECMAEISSI